MSVPIIGPYVNSEIVLIKAVTNLHPGIGKTGEIVDLPVQKDNLGFPIIYASSLKGSLKSALYRGSPNDVKALLGHDPEDATTFTSAVAILDALTVAFPVRSLEGVYAFATSPFLLKRFLDYSKFCPTSNLSSATSTLEKLPKVNDGKCLTTDGAKNNFAIKSLNNQLVINEEIKVACEVNADVSVIEGLLGVEQGRLIILSDNNALRAIERSLVRVTRIAVERLTKKVRTGALWTEEYVPRDTIFVTAFLYSKDAKDRFHKLFSSTNNYLIIGGDETVGKGIVRLEFKG